MDEFTRIERFFRPLATDCPGALDLSDDAGLLPLTGDPSDGLVLTKDALVEGVHVLPDTPPELFAAKALRTNLSDLAAMGAEPWVYLLAVALTKRQDDDWLARFADGLRRDQQAFGIGLLGGDSVSTPGPVTVSITAVGRCPAGQALRRSGARPGDRVWVSGTLGDGALGLLAARGMLRDCPPADRAALDARYHLPQPRLALGRALRGVASAAMDLSDGIGGDADKLCRASGVGMALRLADFPLSPAAAALLRRDPSLSRTAWSGGDDYELLFTAPPDRSAMVGALAGTLDLPLTQIGTVVEGAAARFVDARGDPVALTGWTHS